jgi:hypothetical protein
MLVCLLPRADSARRDYASKLGDSVAVRLVKIDEAGFVDVS